MVVSRPPDQLQDIPLWPPTWPMGLTMLRLVLLPVFLWLLLIDHAEAHPHPHRWYAVGVFAIMAITDKLDGYLARRLNQSSKLGAILDPVADKLLIAISVILLSFDWVAHPAYRIPLIVVAFVYGKGLLVALGAVAMLSSPRRKVTIQARPLGKISTLLQLTLVIVTLIAPDLEAIGPLFPYHLLLGLWWAVCGVAVGAAWDYAVVGWRAYVGAKHSPAGEPRGAGGER